MLHRLFWIAAGAAFFNGGLALGSAGFRNEPGTAATVLELLLW